ncbi:MAG: hypothetical protein M3Y53_08290, partial [Thermoproteota archaeon]|nr:hypothetical protein [Thermoproteota archaeon]
NVNILEPREGIGGHCLPKDTKMFLHSSKSIRSKILTAAMEVDLDYRRSTQFGQRSSQNSSSLTEDSSEDSDRDQVISSR